MTQELIYTSAPKGLQLGSRGFCTVASTAGMSKPLADRLEALSGYKHLYPPGSESAHLNPVNYSFVTFKLGGRTYYVLSRIADAGLDHTQRSNKLAHHVVLEGSELPPAGPAWLMRQPGFFEEKWEGEPRTIEGRRIPLSPDSGPRRCDTWKNVTGDAGWAGVLVESSERNSSMDANIVFEPPGGNSLELVEEAQALLLPSKRWGATFSTFYSKLPPGVECHWRFLPLNSTDAVAARRSHGTLLIDLITTTGINSVTDTVTAARTGAFPSPNPLLRTRTIEQQSFAPTVPVDFDDSREVSHPLSLEVTVSPPKLPAAALSTLRGDIPLPQINKPRPWKLFATVSGILALTVSLLGAALFIFSRLSAPLTDSSNPSPAKSILTPIPTNDTTPIAGTADKAVDNPGARPEPPTPRSPSTPAIGQDNAAPNTPVGEPTGMGPSDLPAASKPEGERPDAPTPANLFDSVLQSIVVPKVTWAAQAREWQKPVPLGTVPRSHPPLSISLHTDGDRQLSIVSSKSLWRVTSLNGVAIAEIRESDTSEHSELQFVWLAEAVRAPDDVAAVEWSCINISPLNTNDGMEQCHVFVSPQASGKLVAEASLSFRKGLSEISRTLETPPLSSIVTRHSIEQDGSKTAPATSKPGEPYEYRLNTTYPLTLSILLEGDREQPKSKGMRVTIRLAAELETGTKCSALDALKYERSDKLRRILLAAIESHALAYAARTNTTKEVVLSNGLHDAFPRKSITDYNKTLNSLSIKDLKEFEADGKEAAQQADYPQLVEQLRLIEDLEKEIAQLPTKVKVNLQVVRQKSTPGEGSGLAEVEVFHAGQLQ